MVDYHIHSFYSFDSEAQLDELCKCARNKRLSEIAITDHVDFRIGKKAYCQKKMDTRKSAIEEQNVLYKNTLVIRNGIEIGQPQDHVENYVEFMKNNSFDFIIASIHFINNVDDSKMHITEDTIDQVMVDYIKRLKEMARTCDFDVLGHIVLPLNYYSRKECGYDIQKNKKDYEELFKILINKNSGIEVNTSGFRKGLSQTSPPREVLQWYKDCGGEIITVGSDAHRTSDIGLGFNKTYEMLFEMGFKSVATYTNRRLIFIPIKG